MSTKGAPLQMKQPCGCGLLLHGISWANKFANLKHEYFREHGSDYEFKHCPTHNAARQLLAACQAIVGVYDGQDDVPLYVRKAREAVKAAEVGA